MKLSDYKRDYYEFSGKASDAARTAAFAGIALIWVFKVDVESGPRLPSKLMLPAALFALALAFDLLQYAVATCIWGLFHRWHESKLPDPNDDPDMSHPSFLEWPILCLFILKMICVVLGYVLVTTYIGHMWVAT